MGSPFVVVISVLLLLLVRWSSIERVARVDGIVEESVFIVLPVKIVGVTVVFCGDTVWRKYLFVFTFFCEHWLSEIDTPATTRRRIQGHSAGRLSLLSHSTSSALLLNIDGTFIWNSRRITWANLTNGEVIALHGQTKITEKREQFPSQSR